jgi:DNA-binding CsgD family transcriptional regulator
VKPDVISIVEAAYRLDLGTKEWLSLLLERCAPLLDRGLGVGATLWRMGQGADESTVVTRRMDDRVCDAILAAARANPRRAHQQSMSGMVYGTALQQAGVEEGDEIPADLKATHEFYFYPLGFRDCLNLSWPDPSGLRVLLCTPIADSQWPAARETAVAGRVAAHIGAGARLRTASTTAKSDPSADADAVLSPSGRVHHARHGAQSRAARDALREATRAVDRARAKDRGSEEALDLWQGLVQGRWSLVDHFDTDGRRYVIARKNDPEVRDPRALTRRERQVLAYSALGHSLKAIAYSLGLAVPTISIHRTRAMRKLGLRSQADVARLFGQGAPP